MTEIDWTKQAAEDRAKVIELVVSGECSPEFIERAKAWLKKTTPPEQKASKEIIKRWYDACPRDDDGSVTLPAIGTLIDAIEEVFKKSFDSGYKKGYDQGFHDCEVRNDP